MCVFLFGGNGQNLTLPTYQESLGSCRLKAKGTSTLRRQYRTVYQEHYSKAMKTREAKLRLHFENKYTVRIAFKRN